MTITQLIEKMRSIDPEGDEEINHGKLDDLLLEYINNEEVTKLFNSIPKWYA